MSWLHFSIAFTLLAALRGWLLISAVLALRRGRANAAGTLVDREKQPGRFIPTVLVQLAFAATAIALLIALLSESFTPAP